jgi:hypothetical protein
MLPLLISLAFTTPNSDAAPVAVDVAGMGPQISVIRRDAALRNWRISCEGHSGEETVIRLIFPAGTSGATVMAYFGPGSLGSSKRFYSLTDPPPDGCDEEPSTTSGAPLRQLGFGPPSLMATQASVARACGFAGVRLRARRRDDVIPAAFASHRDWLILDAGEDALARTGPLLCVVQMGYRALSAARGEGH